MAIRIVNRYKAPEKVALPVAFDYFYKIIVELFAVLGLPVIIALIDRNHKPLVRALHVFNKFAF
jgi:hypothetical protein